MTWVMPVASPYVTSHFNLKRIHPLHRYPIPHTGTDYRASTGTPIYAASDGRVEVSSYDPPRNQGGTGAGNHVRINHGRGVTTRYYHLIRRDVHAGQQVKAGQRIGLAGSTGDSTGPHLHFEVRINNTATDPVPYLAARVGATPVSNPKPTPPAPADPEDWLDMATKAEVTAAVREGNADLVAAVENLTAHLKTRLNSNSADELNVLRDVLAHLKVRLNSNSADTLNQLRALNEKGCACGR